jgi:hypothetical protein
MKMGSGLGVEWRTRIEQNSETRYQNAERRKRTGEPQIDTDERTDGPERAGVGMRREHPQIPQTTPSRPERSRRVSHTPASNGAEVRGQRPGLRTPASAAKLGTGNWSLAAISCGQSGICNDRAGHSQRRPALRSYETSPDSPGTVYALGSAASSCRMSGGRSSITVCKQAVLALEPWTP